MLTVLGSLTDWIFGFHIYKIEIMTCNRSVGRTKVIAVLHIMCSGQCLDGEAVQIQIPFIKPT